MGNERKKNKSWWTFVRGGLAALGLYMMGIVLLALLVVKGIVSESDAFIVLAILCTAAGICGALIGMKKAPVGNLPAGMLSVLVFVLILVMGGACFQQGISWTGKGSILLLCALAGGFVAACFRSRKRRSGKRLRK